MPAALQLEVDRQPAEDVEPTAHAGDKQVPAGRELIEDGQIERQE
jgi:hypothetical protein